MPALLVAAASAFAAWGAAAAVAAAEFTILGLTVATTASLIGSVVGLVVSIAGSMLLGSLQKKPSLPDYAQDRKQAIRSAIEPMRIVYGRTMVSGPIIYMASSGTEQEYLHIIVPVAGHPIEHFEEVWINDKKIVLSPPGVGGMDALDRAGGAFGGTIRIHTYDGTQTAAAAALVAEVPGDWNSGHVGYGIAYLYLRVLYKREVIDSFNTIKAVIRGKRVYDPRSATTAWSNNAALCILDYITSAQGINASIGDEVDLSYWEAAANICDEDVALVSGGGITEKRYRLDGSFKLDETPINIMEALLSSCGGTLTYVGGAYRLHVAAFESPVLTLGVSDFAGNLKISPKPPRRSMTNRVQGTYIDEGQQWTAVSFPPVVVPSFEVEDGETITHDVEFPHVTSRTQVQRLGRLALLRARRSVKVEVPLKMVGQQLSVWSTIGINFPTLSWVNKPFRITAWRFEPGSSVVTIEAREEQANSYTWVHSDAGPDLSTADTSLISPLDLVAPSGLTLTATTSLQGDGSTVPALLVTWTAAANPFATSTEVQWRQNGTTDWSSIEVPAPTSRVVLAPLLSGVAYDVRVRARSATFLTAWTSTSTAAAAADTTPPSVPGSVAAAGVSTGISVTWVKPPELDFVAVEVWENTINDTGSRYYVGQSSGAGFLRSGVGGGGTRYYWVRAYDRSHNYSAFSSVVSATSAQIDTGDVAANAITSLYKSSQNDTILVSDAGMTDITSVTVTTGVGNSVMVTFRADLEQLGLPGDSGSGGGGDAF